MSINEKEKQTLSKIIEELGDDKIILMDSRRSLAGMQHEVQQNYQYLIHELTEKYPHICQRPRCKKKILFGWLYNRVKKQGISLKDFTIMWIAPEYEETEDKPFKFLCYFCYENRLKRERAKKDADFRIFYIKSKVEILFHDLIDFKKKILLLANDDNERGRIWYENLIHFTIMKIYKIRNKTSNSIYRNIINSVIKWKMGDFIDKSFTDMRITTLYFKYKCSIWKIRRYYRKKYKMLPKEYRKNHPKPTLELIKKIIKKDKRFEKIE